MDEHDDTQPIQTTQPAGPIQSTDATQPTEASRPEPAGIKLGLQERAFFAGMIAAQMASEAAGRLRTTKAAFAAPTLSADVTFTSIAGGGPGTRELAAFFWMTIGARMVKDLPALMAESAAEATAEATAGSPVRPESGRPKVRSEEQIIDLQQVFLHGAMTRAPSWLEPAFELTIPTFDAPPFTGSDGNRVEYEALRRLIAVALQRIWGRITDGASEGPVHLDNPHDATWVPVGTFRIRDGW